MVRGMTMRAMPGIPRAAFACIWPGMAKIGLAGPPCHGFAACRMFVLFRSGSIRPV